MSVFTSLIYHLSTKVQVEHYKSAVRPRKPLISSSIDEGLTLDAYLFTGLPSTTKNCMCVCVCVCVFVCV